MAAHDIGSISTVRLDRCAGYHAPALD